MGYQGTSSANSDINYEIIEISSKDDSITLTNLFRANEIAAWKGWAIYVSGASEPSMIDSYSNWTELTRREFSYLKNLIPALNRDGLPEELNH